MTNDKVTIRPALLRFAEQMERVLQANDEKGGWDGCCPGWLVERAGQEMREVRAAYKRWVDFRDFRNGAEEERINAKLQHEVTDVANFCMMVFDVLDKAKPITSEGK